MNSKRKVFIHPTAVVEKKATAEATITVQKRIPEDTLNRREPNSRSS